MRCVALLSQYDEAQRNVIIVHPTPMHLQPIFEAVALHSAVAEEVHCVFTVDHLLKICVVTVL
jgi:hypothetical protein